jgi:magnesium chelatase subunit I
MTGKFELEYEGELKGANQIARDLVRAAVANVFEEYFGDVEMKQVIEWFDLGGSLSLSDTTDAATLLKEAGAVQGLIELSQRAGVERHAPAPLLASAIDFLLEGLYSQKKISRSDARGYHGSEPIRRPQQQPRAAILTPDDDEADTDLTRRKKKYYN